MRLPTGIALLALFAVTAGAVADVYFQRENSFYSDPNSIYRTQQVDFEPIPPAGSDVTVTITVNGDFAGSSKWFSCRFGDTFINSGTVTQLPGSKTIPAASELLKTDGTTQCSCCLYDRLIFSIDRDDFNAERSASGLLQFTAHIPNGVDNVRRMCEACSLTCCTGTQDRANPVACISQSYISVQLDYTPAECVDNGDCDDGDFCNGIETCDGNNECQPGSNPCPGQLCCETIDACRNICCNDANCPGGQHCDLTADECITCLIDSECNPGEFCNDGVCGTAVSCTTDPQCTPQNPAPCVNYSCAEEVDLTIATFDGAPGYTETGTGWMSTAPVQNACIPGTSFRYADLTANPSATGVATWSMPIDPSKPGEYEIFVCYQQSAARSRHVEYIINAPGGPYIVVKDQRLIVSPAEPHSYSLGTFAYAGGETASVSLRLADVQLESWGTLVIADTVRFLRRSACVHTALPNGTACGDGLYCTGDETCDQGVCIESGEPCAAGYVCEEISQACLPDCNGNEVDDAVDIASANSQDCNANEVPDECDLAQPFIFVDSGPLSPVIDGTILSFTVPQAPPALDDVTMGFSAIADLSTSVEYLDVQINGTLVGQVFGASGSDCPQSPSIDQLFVPFAEYNTLLTGGDALIELVPSYEVENICPSTFVEATILYEAFKDTNGNTVPDACEPPDFDGNGYVDLQDFAAFQNCLGMSDGACVDAFDRAAPQDGVVTDGDLPFFVTYLTGPTSGFQMLMGGEGGGEGMSTLMGSESFATGSGSQSAESSTELTASLALEVQPVGGGDALTVLQADTEYELHYHAGNDAIRGLVVFAISTNSMSSAAAADSADSGEWSQAGNFVFTDLRAENPPAAAPDLDEGYYRFGSIIDGFWGDTTTASNAGRLFNFTTGSAGELILQGDLIGDSDGAIVTMHDTLKLVVVAGE